MKEFFITTPIYYVNAHPHLGHAYTSIVADAMARFHKIMGADVFFLTGTDEHGDKIVQAAEAQGQTPQNFVATISAEFRALLPRLNVQNDSFIRTTEEKHKKTVQAILQKVYDSGDIYFGEYGGHYCFGCERFYTEKELLEGGLCPQHLKEPEYISEKNYFFRMANYQDWLKNYILDNPDFIRPDQYRREVLSMLEGGTLDDLCISRPKSRLKWGIELPFDTDYVCYVWFDALLNYITALDWLDNDKKFTRYWPAAQHLVGKDILKPHAIFWPTMLKAAGFKPYAHLNVHGYWLVRDTKMSKSLGNVISPLSVVDTYGADAFRYFLLREMHFGHDASFSEEALIARLNADLANDLGNLASRVLSMTAKYCDSVVPPLGAELALEKDLHQLATDALTNYQTLFSNVRFSNALESLWELIRALNKYVDSAAPWTLHKQGETERLHTVLYTLLENLRKVALALWPVMPESAAKLLAQLGQKSNTPPTKNFAMDSSAAALQSGITVAASSNLFPRIEVEKKTAEQKPVPQKKASKQETQAALPTDTSCIEFADFQKLDLRLGTILSAEKHPDADKLLRVEIDLNEGNPRQIIAGIAEFFSPEDLINKQVVVVCNLAPRKLRGLESNGMILAIRTSTGMQLLSCTGPVPNGSKVS